MVTFLAFVSSFMLVVFFFLHRNNWVLKNRINCLAKEGHDEYNKLPTYMKMFFKFWIWDIDKFKINNKKG